MATRKMHQTTVRFGPELWEELERESADTGVSIAQYLREAASARLIYSAAVRGDQEFALALDIATAREGESPTGAPSAAAESSTGERRSATQAVHAALALENAESEAGSAAALWAQSRQARLRAQQLRREIEQRRVRRA